MIYASTTGLIHLIASIIALIAGTFVITTQKGTAIHKKIGYIYAVSMTVLIITAFMIYRLFGEFGIFHIAAVISTIALLGGIIPAIFRKPEKHWLGLHFNFMYWSVMGLYAAFVGEVFTRVPQSPFYRVIGVGTTLVMVVAYLFYFKYKKNWEKIEAAYIDKN